MEYLDPLYLLWIFVKQNCMHYFLSSLTFFSSICLYYKKKKLCTKVVPDVATHTNAFDFIINVLVSKYRLISI